MLSFNSPSACCPINTEIIFSPLNTAFFSSLPLSFLKHVWNSPLVLTFLLIIQPRIIWLPFTISHCTVSSTVLVTNSGLLLITWFVAPNTTDHLMTFISHLGSVTSLFWLWSHFISSSSIPPLWPALTSSLYIDVFLGFNCDPFVSHSNPVFCWPISYTVVLTTNSILITLNTSLLAHNSLLDPYDQL